MKKNEKINIVYSSPQPTNGFLTSLRAADEADLRLLLALSMHKESDELDIEALGKSLELTEEELAASIKYWCGAGILKKAKKTEAKSSVTKDKPNTEHKTAHANGKLERAEAAPSYSSAELADLIDGLFIDGEIDIKNDAVVADARQHAGLVLAAESIRGAIAGIDAGLALDLSCIDVEGAMMALGELEGREVEEEIVSEIFSKFCVGK